jgi:hypothetical protein
LAESLEKKRAVWYDESNKKKGCETMTNHVEQVLYYGGARIRPHRMTIAERFRLWRRRRWRDDLAGVGT